MRVPLTEFRLGSDPSLEEGSAFGVADSEPEGVLLFDRGQDFDVKFCGEGVPGDHGLSTVLLSRG